MSKQLGANLIPSETPFVDYNTRLAAVIAGDDLPDAFYVGVVTKTASATQFLEFLTAKCADLTDILGSDAIKQFRTWQPIRKCIGVAWSSNNRLYGVPAVIPGPLCNLWVHADLLDSTGGAMPTALTTSSAS
jgi:hypothetical protein